MVYLWQVFVLVVKAWVLRYRGDMLMLGFGCYHSAGKSQADFGAGNAQPG